jgi:hypothetical protein
MKSYLTYTQSGIWILLIPHISKISSPLKCNDEITRDGGRVLTDNNGNPILKKL